MWACACNHEEMKIGERGPFLEALERIRAVPLREASGHASRTSGNAIRLNVLFSKQSGMGVATRTHEGMKIIAAVGIRWVETQHVASLRASVQVQLLFSKQLERERHYRLKPVACDPSMPQACPELSRRASACGNNAPKINAHVSS